jgi:hypothetical protein
MLSEQEVNKLSNWTQPLLVNDEVAHSTTVNMISSGAINTQPFFFGSSRFSTISTV